MSNNLVDLDELHNLIEEIKAANFLRIDKFKFLYESEHIATRKTWTSDLERSEYAHYLRNYANECWTTLYLHSTKEEQKKMDEILYS